jgi:CheY-like chemotaxis protein
MSDSPSIAASPKLQTVLFVDDDPQDLDTWSKRLSEHAPTYSVVRATDVPSALSICQSQNVDCIILDLDLWEGSGFEVLLSLIPDRHRPSVPIVVLTKLPYPNVHEMVMHNGARACLVKQRTSSNDLHTAIQQAIASIDA